MRIQGTTAITCYAIQSRIYGPNPDMAPPDTFAFVKGTCRLQVNPAIPEVGAYQRCLFTRKTAWGDRFTFRLHGKNVAYVEDVEAHLQDLLETWRTGDQTDSE